MSPSRRLQAFTLWVSTIPTDGVDFLQPCKFDQWFINTFVSLVDRL